MKVNEAEIEELVAYLGMPRWRGIIRPYTPDKILRLRGSIMPACNIADIASHKLWHLLHKERFVTALGVLNGSQAVQAVQAGMKAIYMSGWQVAADANLVGETYPDQSLYPSNSGVELVRRINKALLRADRLQRFAGEGNIDWFAPVIADCEAGFGGLLHAFELTTQMVEAGAACVHFEDQLASEKKCGHLGGKVLVPVTEFIRKLVAARLASDVLGVPTIIMARTDAEGARLITSDIDDEESEFISSTRTVEGFHIYDGGIDAAIQRAIRYAPYADMLWCETSSPDLEEAEQFAKGVHRAFPGKLLAYNCSPSFNWERSLARHEIESFQEELSRMGYKFQFITLAGFHLTNFNMFTFARSFLNTGMTAYSSLQRREFEAVPLGYRAVKHQFFAGTPYFDFISETVTQGTSSTKAMSGSTEEAQFSFSRPERINETR